MKHFEFALVVEGFDPLNGEHMTKLFSALPEVTASGWQGHTLMEFSLAGNDALSVLRKARKAIERSVPGARVLSLAEDLVGVPDIASRTGRSEESIRQLVIGARGSGNFPLARGVLKGGSRIWRWSDVVPWLTKNDVLTTYEDEFVDPASGATFELELTSQNDGIAWMAENGFVRRPSTPGTSPRKASKAGAAGSKLRTGGHTHIAAEEAITRNVAARKSAASKKSPVRATERFTSRRTPNS